ncbi:MAG: hypothetical protein ACTSVI_03980 [Promethearchaeota archaeon]
MEPKSGIVQKIDLNTLHHQERYNLKVLKCSSCRYNKNLVGSPLEFEENPHDNVISVKVSIKCGFVYKLIFDHDFRLVEHQCSAYTKRQENARAFVDDEDIEKFLESDAPIEALLNKGNAFEKTHEKDIKLENDVKSFASLLRKPLALLIPTKPQKKTVKDIQKENEKVIKQSRETDENLPYLRVLAFEKLARGQHSYPIDKFCKLLKDIDKKYIIGFIKKINNDFLISYDEKNMLVRFYNPSLPELEILSREFEKWLRFNRL